MACGLPVVTTAQPWLTGKGKAGIFVERNDPILIKNAVSHLIGNREEYLSKKQNAKILAEQYDWKRIAKDAIRHYEKVLSHD